MLHALPVVDDYSGVVYNALVAQGPIERRRRARAQQGQTTRRRASQHRKWEGALLAPSEALVGP